MGKKTLPVGSIVEIKGIKAMVTGIRFDESEDGYLAKSYLIVPYPYGFSGSESCRLVRADETETVWESPRTAQAEAYLSYVDNMEIAAEKADAKTILDHFAKLSKTGLEGA